MASNIEFVPADKLKDFLNKQTSAMVGKPIDVVEKVISFAFKDAKDHLKNHNEVVIAGWGTLIVSLPKLRRKLNRAYISLDRTNKALKGDLSEESRQIHEKKAITLQKNIELLEVRFNKFPKDED